MAHYYHLPEYYESKKSHSLISTFSVNAISYSAYPPPTLYGFIKAQQHYFFMRFRAI